MMPILLLCWTPSSASTANEAEPGAAERTEPRPILLRAGEGAPESGTFYPGRESILLIRQLASDAGQLMILERRVAAQQATITRLEEELRLEVIRTMTQAALVQAEAASCPSLLERNTGTFLGVGACVGTDGEVHGGVAALVGFRLGRWRRGR